MDVSKVVSGDYYGDGYADFAFVTKDGVMQILSNNQGVFDRSNIGTSRDISLDNVRHIQSFDMDRDGFDDIVFVDATGSIYVLYGDESEIFQVQFIEKAFTLQFSDQAKREYFHG